MVYPDYQPVTDQRVREKFQELWGTKLDPRPGLTVVEIMDAVHEGEIRGMYIMGENPAMSDPDLNHARAALARIEHLVVQDIFFTETAGFADIILPASAFPEKTGTFTNTDRRVQIGRQVIDPPGDARQDLWIIQELARRMGLPWPELSPRQVFEEICRVTPSMGGMTWERLEREESLTYPLREPGDPGQPIIFTDAFPTEDTRGRFVPAEYTEADELPDADFPMVFTTGRQLEHWHTGSMTRRAPILAAIEPIPVANINGRDLESAGVAPGSRVILESRRGSLAATARLDNGVQPGTVFMAFCYREAAANLLTNPALDPYGKIPEFKFCAVRLRPAAETA
jgi:formate dehydrogenase major subunit